MDKIMNFIYKNKLYTIYEVDRIEGKSSYIGETNYDNGRILIEKADLQTMIETLKHELAHVWLYENGHAYQEGGCFTYEDLCEYIAFSNRFVFEISEKYLNAKIFNQYEWRN